MLHRERDRKDVSHLPPLNRLFFVWQVSCKLTQAPPAGRVEASQAGSIITHLYFLFERKKYSKIVGFNLNIRSTIMPLVLKYLDDFFNFLF